VLVDETPGEVPAASEGCGVIDGSADGYGIALELMQCRAQQRRQIMSGHRVASERPLS
jgi:hypothetical protein